MTTSLALAVLDLFSFFGQYLAQFGCFSFKVDIAQKVTNRFGTHTASEILTKAELQLTIGHFIHDQVFWLNRTEQVKAVTNTFDLFLAPFF